MLLFLNTQLLFPGAPLRIFFLQSSKKCVPSALLGPGGIEAPAARKLEGAARGPSQLRHGGGARLRRRDVLYVLCREVARCTAGGHAPVDDAVQERVPAQAVVAVDAAGRLAGRVEPLDYIVPRAEALRIA
eukprot:CAMPEP_0179288550 /NCGR_PEP_ID=MMETSP0797-20121207/40841_1 /TAXON_ID=47934 /ORGANISM="Dinophysis acuminata, Strain DAEP01" /LENGTH=130 /DNA_ID=CAMNT_0020997521 /DNA_START=290 /DNA_END=678 /DNA_ORIENTATION=-